MGAAVCAKILLCSPPIANRANEIRDAVNRYLAAPKEMPLDPSKLVAVIEHLEAAEESLDNASEALVAALGPY